MKNLLNISGSECSAKPALRCAQPVLQQSTVSCISVKLGMHIVLVLYNTRCGANNQHFFLTGVLQACIWYR